MPASLRENYRKEQKKFTDLKAPSDVMSYSELALGKPVENTGTVILDEAHRTKSVDSLQTQKAMAAARRAKQLLLLTGSPIQNHPSELAPLMSMLNNDREPISPTEFTRRYVTTKKTYPSWWRHMLGWSSGTEHSINHQRELEALLRGHVDWYSPDKPTVPTQQEDIVTEMTVPQAQLYAGFWGKLPMLTKWKLARDIAPLTPAEMVKMQSFLVGPRQVGLSTLPYQRVKNPMKAFRESGKLTVAHANLVRQLKADPRTKAAIFSSFVHSALAPYSAALTASDIPHAIFHGGLSDSERRRIVDDYGSGKLRAILLGPSGSEGLSLAGTQLVQILDPGWNSTRGKQQMGRALRWDSHEGLPEELRNVRVERYIARLPLGFKDRLLRRVGFNRERQSYAADDYLRSIERRKDKLNQPFNDLLRRIGSERD